MLWTTAAQSVSKNITCTSVRMRGAFSFNIRKHPSSEDGGWKIENGGLILERGWIAMRAGSFPPVKLRGNSGGDFFHVDGFHAAEIDGALAQETGTAFDLMPKNVVPTSQGSGQPRFSRAKDRDDGNADERGEVHRAGVIRQQQGALAQLGGELVESGLADSI